LWPVPLNINFKLPLGNLTNTCPLVDLYLATTATGTAFATAGTPTGKLYTTTSSSCFVSIVIPNASPIALSGFSSVAASILAPAAIVITGNFYIAYYPAGTTPATPTTSNTFTLTPNSAAPFNTSTTNAYTLDQGVLAYP